MGLQPIDFHGIIELDRKVVDQLDYFLQEKENQLAHQILDVIPISLEESPSVALTPPGMKISDAVEGFTKKVRNILQSGMHMQGSKNLGEKVVKDLNSILWNFTEVLEECVVELFRQVHQVRLDRWHLSIAQVVHDIKDVLIHYLEDLIWTIRRLEKPLNELCLKLNVPSKQGWWDRMLSRNHFLDHTLSENLNQTEKYLKTQYDLFKQQYREFSLLNVLTEESLEKMKHYPILALMNLTDQNLYVDVYRLLHMIEINRNSKSDLAKDTVRALRNLTSIENVLEVFQIYYDEIKDAFFNSSLEWKSFHRTGENYQEVLSKLRQKVDDYRIELQALIKTISRYRTAILKNDANPYVRSRWGFSEWVVGPEPVKIKKTKKMIFLAEEIDRDLLDLKNSFERDPQVQQKEEKEVQDKIENILHEMGQPLISHSMMKVLAGRLLNELQVCDEIGNPHRSVIMYFEDVLSKAMREDWRYHVLHEFPLFHKIYHHHEGLVERFEDPTHAYRIERFQLLFNQIEEWVAKDDIYSHIHEIDLDINDMKTYLQDCLATVQRAAREHLHDPFLDETVQKLHHQLLEYRYIFGQFFFNIMSKSTEGKHLRNQFLFVNQYFETIESLLNELKLNWKGEKGLNKGKGNE